MIFFHHQLSVSTVSHTDIVLRRRGVAVSILACQAKGRGFKSRRLRTWHFREPELIGIGQLNFQLTYSFMDHLYRSGAMVGHRPSLFSTILRPIEFVCG